MLSLKGKYGSSSSDRSLFFGQPIKQKFTNSLQIVSFSCLSLINFNIFSDAGIFDMTKLT